MTLEQVMETVSDKLSPEDRLSLAVTISTYGHGRYQKGIYDALFVVDKNYTVTALHEPATIDIAHKTTAA